MMLLVLRPAVGAEATAARARAAGHSAVVAPLFRYRPFDWPAPPGPRPDALLLTSAAAPRLAGAGLARYRDLPVQAVGTATAAAAVQAGFAAVRAGAGDAQDALAALFADGHRRVLHLTGQDHLATSHPGLAIERVPVYAADAVARLPSAAAAALADGTIALLHSPRAARVFAALVNAAGQNRGRIRIACFSAAVARAAGAGWASVGVARAPTDEALFAAAAMVCDQHRDAVVEP